MLFATYPLVNLFLRLFFHPAATLQVEATCWRNNYL